MINNRALWYLELQLCRYTYHQRRYDLTGSRATESHPLGIHKYKEAIACRLYLSTRTRPDIAAAIGIFFRDCNASSTKSWVGINRVLRYFAGTAEFGLLFQQKGVWELPLVTVYSDAGWAANTRDGKSTSRYVVYLNGTPVSWFSKSREA